MDSECPQFQVSDLLLNPGSSMHDGGQRYPGRSLFGTTLDSKGYYKGLSEEEQTFPVLSDARPSHQPVSQLEKHRGSLCKTESGSILKPGLDSLRMMSPKSGNTKMAIGTKYDAKDCKPELKESLKRVPLSRDGIRTEVQTDGDMSPVPSTPRTITESVQSPCETPSREEDNVIPKNIKHKFGSHVVDELLTDDEVSEFLKQKKKSSKSSDLEDSPVQPQEKITDHINWYERIGYPLRCNIFPGPSGEWQSEAQSTYTKEVHHRSKHNLEHWHGRTTDQLGNDGIVNNGQLLLFKVVPSKTLGGGRTCAFGIFFGLVHEGSGGGLWAYHWEKRSLASNGLCVQNSCGYQSLSLETVKVLAVKDTSNLVMNFSSGVWTTDLLACERLSRTLQQDFEERPKLTKKWPSVISRLGPGEPTVQSQPRPPKALRKAIPKPKKITPKLEGTTAKPRTAAGTELREEIKTPAGRNVEKDESFWEFYNQPLPLP
ncbi:uncharacterized protein LOC121271479 [Carcharodon carcharias]|uniref:uncharacterized protein LOC121271479 n=1 Tax=Carcharodon carcharias TaxID=13397 RepID=UPI001B7E2DA0|nr:uncharacterized protein LOC121271479 [Carcharodon carcharias]